MLKQKLYILIKKQFKKCRLLLLLGFACCLLSRVGYAQVSQENLIKAVYIEKFTRFVEWPDQFLVNDTTKPFYIGILGKSNMATTLKEVYRKLPIRNKLVEVEEITGMDDLKDKGRKYHVLFVPSDSEKWLDDVIEYSVQNNILTIGDGKNFAKRGIHINFVVFEDRVHYTINESSVYNSDLYMSYRLLNSAIIVSSD